MKLSKILEKINVIECSASLDTEISDICYDSRSAKAGCLFVAIEGFKSDGSSYIPAAMESGAVVVLCSRVPSVEVSYVLVSDTRLALAIASQNFFENAASKLKLIGITGTNGKTSSALLMKHLLEECTDAKVGLIGTNGILIGESEFPSERTTPESYELHKLFHQMVQEGCTHVVMEVSSHSLVLSRVSGLRFALGIFTNLTQDHLDFHGTMEEYVAAKAILFSNCDKAVINVDDEYGGYMKEKALCPVMTYSAKTNDADLIAKDIKLMSDCVKFCVVTLGEISRVTIGIPGRFSVYNALGVIGGGMSLGIDMESCAKALVGARGVKGRLETVDTDGEYTVIIDYAHTPDALQNVLAAVRETSAGRVVVVFGCGGDRDKTKRPVMGDIATQMSDFSIITSDNPRSENPDEIICDIIAGVKVKKSKYVTITDRVAAIKWAIENHEKGDIIVLAGKGHETYQEIDNVKCHMDEREIVADIIEMRKNK